MKCLPSVKTWARHSAVSSWPVSSRGTGRHNRLSSLQTPSAWFPTIIASKTRNRLDRNPSFSEAAGTSLGNGALYVDRHTVTIDLVRTAFEKTWSDPIQSRTILSDRGAASGCTGSRAIAHRVAFMGARHDHIGISTERI